MSEKKAKEILIELKRKKIKILSEKIGNMENKHREFSIDVYTNVCVCVYASTLERKNGRKFSVDLGPHGERTP